MSIIATAVKHLLAAGLGDDEIVYAVELLEAEDGQGVLRVFVELVRAHNIPSDLAGHALLEVARAVVQPEVLAWRPKDDFTGARDSNRARRAMPDKEWRRLRGRIFERDGHKCQYCYCTTDDLTCDHIIPLVRGGTNDPENLTAACRSCNSSKGDKLLSEWSPL